MPEPETQEAAEPATEPAAEPEQTDQGDGDNPDEEVTQVEEQKKTIISLGELVDLALCTPEPGAVNFNLLRSVLHALVNRLDLVDIKAEILDEDTDNVFSQIMDNAEKLGLKDMRPRSHRKDRDRESSHHHHGRRSHRASRRTTPQGRSDDPASAGTGPGSGAAGTAPGTGAAGTAPGSGGTDGGGAPGSGGAGAEGGGSAEAGKASGEQSDHSEEFDQLREEMCPPDSAGQPDVAGRPRSKSAERTEQAEGGDGKSSKASDGGRRSSSAANVQESGSVLSAGGSPSGSASKRLSDTRLSSSDSLGLSSGSASSSDSDTASGRARKRATLSELAEHRLKQSGRQSAVSISDGVEGSAVLSDYTSLDRLEKKLELLEQKLDVMELSEMLPKVRELQAAVNNSQEDVSGLWQSLQLMKKVDANEEGINKLTGIIEHSMEKLKKIKKHTDKIDKELAGLLGGKSRSGKGEKPISLSAMEKKYEDIKHMLDGLLGGMPGEGDGEDVPEGDAADGSGGGGGGGQSNMREVGAQIITWNTLEDALKDDILEMEDLNDQAMQSVSEQKMEMEGGGAGGTAPASGKASKVKRLLANLSKLVEKHKALENRVKQMESALGDNFSDRVLEQLQLLKASATQIQQLRNKLSQHDQADSGGDWADLDVVGDDSIPAVGAGAGGGGGRAGSAGSTGLGGGIAPIAVSLPRVREPSEMDLNHLSDWLNYNKARMEQLEKALVSQSEQVRDFGDRLGDQVVSFRDKLERVERELAGMLGRISSSANKGGMSREDSAALHEAYSKLQALQMDVEALSNTSKKIVADRGQIDDELSMLIRALEELKECKVDRATLDELIETKADRSSVEKKVSNWQFEQACQELSEGLGSMLEKLGSQETDWVRSVDEIHADLHKKLDRVELGPLRRYINSRLKNIMTKLNRLIAEDESSDACTTRRKILKNLNCLSCDDPKKITGHTSAPNVPMLDPFPPSVGDRHQTSFRMGTIRRQQQQRCEPYKDLTSHEGAFRSHIKQEIDYMTHRGIPHHPTCPRYNNRVPYGRCTCVATRFCGGSHTKINCIDTRRRRVGLGAPLLPFGSPLPGAPSPGRASKERLSKTPSDSSQRSAGGRKSSTRPGSAAAAPASPGTPGTPGSRRGSGSAGLRQVRSSGSGVRKKASTPTSTSKSAPGFIDAETDGQAKAEPAAEPAQEPVGDAPAPAEEAPAATEEAPAPAEAPPAEEAPASTEAPAEAGVAAAPPEGEAPPEAAAEAPAEGAEAPAEAGEAAPEAAEGAAPAAEGAEGEAAAASEEAPAADAPAAEGEAPAAVPEGEAPPAEGESAPTEGEAAPTEGEAVPAEGVPAPAEGEAAPAEAAPAEGEAAPAEGEAASAEGEAAPAEGEAAPADAPGESPPADGEAALAEAPAAEGETPAAEGAESPKEAAGDAAAAAEPAADGESPPPAADAEAPADAAPAEEKTEEAPAAEAEAAPAEGGDS